MSTAPVNKKEGKVEWRESTIGEVCSFITDGAHKSPPSVENGFPMASVKDMSRYGINTDTARHISPKDFKNLVKGNCQPKSGDVLLAKDGAKALQTVCEVDGTPNYVLLSSVAILRPNREEITPSFLRYYLDSDQTREYMRKAFMSGAAIPRIVLKDLKVARIRMPSLNSTFDKMKRRTSGKLRSLSVVDTAGESHWFWGASAFGLATARFSIERN